MISVGNSILPIQGLEELRVKPRAPMEGCLLSILPLATTAYSVWTVYRNQRLWLIGSISVATAFLVLFCIFALPSIVSSYHTPSSFDPLGDGFALGLRFLFYHGLALAIHLSSFSLLILRRDSIRSE